MGLKKIHIKGFKSIREQTLEFGLLNVFIGGNGAGKSNLIGVFHFLRQIVSKSLQVYSGTSGANSILHFGRKKTESLQIEVIFRRDATNENSYKFTLNPTDEDRFIFEEETTHYRNTVRYPAPQDTYNDQIWSGHSEAKISESKKQVARYLQEHLSSYRIYHFHDTSSSAKVKQTCDLNDNRLLHTDAGNLAAFLYLLQKRHPGHFQNIEDTIRQVAPFFHRFNLEPSALNPDKIRLEWLEKGSEAYFNATALSDGTLRFMCLATLLLQPVLPSLILIDEPELGLHPSAIQVLAALMQSAATRTQLIVSTQSVTLINQLSPEDVWVVDREDGQSVFRHLHSADMSSWLDGYSLGELWEKNFLGGRP